MSEFKTQNDKAWKCLFDKYNILENINDHGSIQISANQIKEFREPRLMAKFDHHNNLPDIFQKHKLCILPISRSDYLISNFEAYHNFEPINQDVLHTNLPGHLQSLNAQNISSEIIAVNCALASGILSDFLEEDAKVLFATVNGRMGSSKFKFNIDKNDQTTTDIDVDRTQIEIDAAFEGERSLSILEAKLDISDDFLVRQLYYPFRVWKKRIDKQVRPIFLVYSNGIFNLYEYEFQDEMSYNSIHLIKAKKYSLEGTDIDIELSDLQEIANSSKIISEPEVSFPQADSFERVINLCELLYAKEILSRDKITENYDFTKRQTNYYTSAGMYLGLIEKTSGAKRMPFYFLNDFGKKITQMSCKRRQIEFCKLILQHKIFNKAFLISMAKGNIPDKPVVIELMKKHGVYNLNIDASTVERRASSVRAWVEWMIKLSDNV